MEQVVPIIEKTFKTDPDFIRSLKIFCQYWSEELKKIGYDLYGTSCIPNEILESTREKAVKIYENWLAQELSL